MEDNGGAVILAMVSVTLMDNVDFLSRLYCLLNIDLICLMNVDQEQLSLNLLIVLRC